MKESDNIIETNLTEDPEGFPVPSHTHTHGHHHDPEEKKKQINRIARIIGHLEHVKKMLEADEDCTDVLVQISAVKSALNGLGREIIKEHTAHCISHAIEDGDAGAVQDFMNVMQKYLDV